VVLEVQSGGHYRIDESLRRGSGDDPRSIRPAPSGAAERNQSSHGNPLRAPARHRGSAAPGTTATLQTGFLRVHATPGDAAVYLDGEFLATADDLSRLSGGIPVALGEHTLEVVRPGYGDARVPVVVDGQAPVRIQVDLRTGE
jgi:hypothetical protein